MAVRPLENRQRAGLRQQINHALPAAVIGIILILAVLTWLTSVVGNPPLLLVDIADRVSTFSAIFLGIFIEAAPYLLLGTLASGLVEEFVDRDELSRLLPKNKAAGAVVGGLMGLFFPVCECGVVPLTRRLFRKGLPLSVGVSFLLAAPVLNPIVIASTYSAFGPGVIFWGRLGLSLAIAVATGIIFSMQSDANSLLQPVSQIPDAAACELHPEPLKETRRRPLGTRLRRVLVVASDEFFEMGRYLIIGGILAALMQTLIPQSSLLSVGQGPLFSVLVMILLAVVLSICSTVDAFIALAFTTTFSSGSILAFLVFGPMVDIKSTIMFLQVFRKRTVVYLILLPLMMTILATVAINTFGGM